MSFLDDYTYYLRMDDDSLFTDDLLFDPFYKMQQEGLMYDVSQATTQRMDFGVQSRSSAVGAGTSQHSHVHRMEGLGSNCK